MATIINITADPAEGNLTVLRVWNKKDGVIAKEERLKTGESGRGENSEWADVTICEERDEAFWEAKKKAADEAEEKAKTVETEVITAGDVGELKL